MTRLKAYSYVRFSTPEQSKGDSLRRQTEQAELYAEEKGLELDLSSYRDLGISAYHGEHARAGELGRFLTATKEGVIESGSFLLVENLDRISRQDPLAALYTLSEICRQGITVVTLTDRQEYTEEGLRDPNKTTLLMSILQFSRAHSESQRKGQLLREAWVKKRRQGAEGKPMTAQCPAWLRVNNEAEEFEPIPERVKVVRRIFREALKGVGPRTIATNLNSDGVPVFGRGKMWYRSYVVKILGNPAVVGTFTPHVMQREEDQDGRVRQKRKPLDPIKGYFPKIVRPKDFKAVQTLRSGSRNPRRGRHAGKKLRNIFGGLAKCGRCKETAHRVNKGKPPKGAAYLVCSHARHGVGCQYETVRYEVLEGAFLREIGPLLNEIPAGDKDQEVDAAIRGTEAALERTREEIANLLNAAKGGSTASIVAELEHLESSEEELQEELHALLERKAAVMPRMVQRRADELWGLLANEDGSPWDPEELDRARINAGLRQLFDSVTVNFDAGTLDFAWKHDGQSSILYDVERMFPPEDSDQA